MIKKWNVYCETEATDVAAWASAAPTECPNDAGHTIGAVTAVVKPDTVSVPVIAELELYFYDGADVWKMTVGTDGAVNTVKQT